jgi:hypothetical protein
MKFIRSALAIGLVAGASVVAACSSQHSSYTGGNNGKNGPTAATTGATGQVGSVKMQWNFAPGDSVFSLNWTISNGTNTYSNVDNFGDAQSAEFVAGGILAGCGYTLTVTGTDTNNDPCTGTVGPFCVLPSVVNYESLNVTCLAPSDSPPNAAIIDTGSVAVEAGVTIVNHSAYSCPGINSFGITPAELLGSQPATLTVATMGPSNGILWSNGPCTAFAGGAPTGATVGGFVGADGGQDITDNTVSFNCGACTGQVLVTATTVNNQIQPGSDAATNVCAGVPFTSMTGIINCEGGGTTPCFGTNCPTAPMSCLTASEALTDPNNCGGCGIVCGAPSGGTSGGCVNGSCVEVCPAGTALCSASQTPPNTCVPDQTDANNCGACGNVCPSGQPCVAGACVAPVPCNGTGSTPTPAGCVQCPGGNLGTGNCTGTEQLIVKRDIHNNFLTGGQLTGGGVDCFSCLNAAAFLTTARECESLGGALTTECLNTLSCDLGVTNDVGGAGSFASCANSPSPGLGIDNCFCGSNYNANLGGCNGASETTGAPVANGACIATQIAGFTGATNTTLGSTIIGEITTVTQASGRANTILKNAGSNSSSPNCAQCFQ